MKDLHIFNKIELGFIFEYAFNLGICGILEPYMNKNKKLEIVLDKYIDESGLHRKNIHKIMAKKFGIHDLDQEKEVNEVIDKLLFYGHCCGQSIMTDYLKSKGLISSFKYSNQEDEKKAIIKARFIVDFIHCNLVNPLGIADIELDKKRKDFTNDIFKTAFGIELSPQEYNDYSLKGQFLNADSLIMISTRKTHYILVIDNKIKLSTALKSGDCWELLDTLCILLAEKSKKVKFNNLDTDSSFIEGFKLAPRLIDYASTMNESTLLKVTQAGSYAHSFLSMVNSKKLINKEVNVSLSGYFDSDYSFINYETCSHDNKELMDSLYEFKKAYLNWERNEIPPEEFQKQRAMKQKSIYNNLKRNLIKDSNIPREDFKALGEFENGKVVVKLSELLEGYTPTSMRLRQEHSTIIYEDLINPNIQIITLNGCPGIGKTTSIVNVLKGFDKFTFMYIPPRTALGDDIESKFKREDGRLYADDLIFLSTSSKDEEQVDGKPVVNFTSNSAIPPETSDLAFLHKDRIRDHFENESKVLFRMKTPEKCEVIEQNKVGTLYRLCKGQKISTEDPNYNKIISIATIQSTKLTGNSLTTEHLMTAFPFIIKGGISSSSYSIDSQALLKFAKKMPNVFIMIDEITGTDEGIALYRMLKEMLIKPMSKLPQDVREKFNLKLIVADASLTNSTIVSHHLEGNKSSKIVEANGQKIYVSEVQEKDKKTLYREVIDTKAGPMSIINANSYPAGKLRLNYFVSLNKNIIQNEAMDFKLKEKNKDQNKKIIEECLDYLINKNELQTIIYIQDVRRLDTMVLELKNRYKAITGKVLELNKDYLIITSRLKAYERNLIIDYNNKQADAPLEEKRLRVIFMTSSASRGISFKDCKSVNCVSQLHSIESSLMEIVQLVYRPRGHKDWDVNEEKTLNFYIIQDVYALDEQDFEFKKYQTLSAVLSYIVLLRGSILTRIQGYTTIAGKDISLIPLGSTGVQGVSNSIVENIGEAIREIGKELYVNKDKRLFALNDRLMDIFSTLTLNTFNQVLYNNKDEVTTEASVYSNFLKTLDKGPLALVKKRFFKDFYVINGLAVFKISETEDEVHLIKERLLKNRGVLLIIEGLLKDCTVNDKIKKPLSNIYDLLLFDAKHSTSYSKALSEGNNNESRFIAFPLDSFRIYNQFEGMVVEKDKINFGQVIHKLMQNYVGVHSVLPIVTNEYSGLPFITFKSSDLESKRLNLFKDNYLMTSTELNLLNLLLLDKEQ